MDRISLKNRSWNMSRIRSKDTSIEVAVRSYLFKLGYRFRKNVKNLPGKPDIVLPKYKTVIFVNGCFWHRHSGCRFASVPKSRIEYWNEKFRRNTENDSKNKEILESMGWKVIVLWECDLKKQLSQTVDDAVVQFTKFYEKR